MSWMRGTQKTVWIIQYRNNLHCISLLCYISKANSRPAIRADYWAAFLLLQIFLVDGRPGPETGIFFGMKTIQRIRSADNYTIIPNVVFNSGLSLKSIGLLTFLLQLPDDWKLYKNYIYDVMQQDGKDAINSAWKQLEQTGFILKKTVPGGGKNGLPEIQYFIFDTPQKVADFPQQLPDAGFPTPEIPQRKNRERKNRQLLSTNLPSTNISVLSNDNTGAYAEKKLKPAAAVKAPPVPRRPPADKPKDEYWQQWVDSWHLFFPTMNEGRKPMWNGSQCKGLKDIRNFMQQNAKRIKEDPPDQPQEITAFNAWAYLLKHWKKLDDWQQKQFDLTVIAKKLPEFLNQIRNQNARSNTNGTTYPGGNGQPGISQRKIDAAKNY